MPERNYMPRYADSFQGFCNGTEPVSIQASNPIPSYPAAMQEVNQMPHMEIQRILVQNQLVNTHLQRELAAAREKICRLILVRDDLIAENERQTWELFDKEMRLEAAHHASELLQAEVTQLRADFQDLNASRRELTTQLQSLTKDLNYLQAENQQLIAMRADVEGLHKELADAESRKHGLGGYGMMNGSPEMRHPGSAFAEG